MLVNSLRGTSDNTCNCDSWLAHWGKYSGQILTVLTTCSVIGCRSKAEVGAHVQLSGSGLLGLAGLGAKWYIVPMCQTHNLQGGQINVSDSVGLASANVAETCGQGIVGLLKSRMRPK